MRLHTEDYIHSRSNQWGLTPPECAVMNAMVRSASRADAAKKLECPVSVVNGHLKKARVKMNRSASDVRFWTEWSEFTRSVSSAPPRRPRLAALLSPRPHLSTSIT